MALPKTNTPSNINFVMFKMGKKHGDLIVFLYVLNDFNVHKTLVALFDI